MDIRVDDLTNDKVQALLRVHLESLALTAPAESLHALDLTGLKHPAVTFWCLWDGDELAGFGALKELSPHHGELKSMRTAAPYRRRGVAASLVTHIVESARQRGYESLFLETGSVPFFTPAHELYRSFGFVPCGPFADYRADPNSVFMSRDLAVSDRPAPI